MLVVLIHVDVMQTDRPRKVAGLSAGLPTPKLIPARVSKKSLCVCNTVG
jgi:hypothetical protein